MMQEPYYLIKVVEQSTYTKQTLFKMINLLFSKNYLFPLSDLSFFIYLEFREINLVKVSKFEIPQF